MSISSDKRLDVVDIIDKIFYELKFQINKEIRITSEREIDKILSEPGFGLNFVQSVLQQKVTMTTNADQQTDLALQQSIISGIVQETVKPKKSPKKQADKKVEETTTEIIQIAKQLKTANSREEGRAILTEYLNKHRNIKAQLISLAKYLEIPIGKLNKDKLAEKIIQETIGHRIDSMIIQEHKWDK